MEGFKTAKKNFSLKEPACRQTGQTGMIKYQLVNIDLNA
jgi:hypothetical protein